MACCCYRIHNFDESVQTRRGCAVIPQTITPCWTRWLRLNESAVTMIYMAVSRTPQMNQDYVYKGGYVQCPRDTAIRQERGTVINAMITDRAIFNINQWRDPAAAAASIGSNLARLKKRKRKKRSLVLTLSVPIFYMTTMTMVIVSGQAAVWHVCVLGQLRYEVCD